MKAEIKSDGKLNIQPENETESFALKMWTKENQNTSEFIQVEELPKAQNNKIGFGEVK